MGKGGSCGVSHFPDALLPTAPILIVYLKLGLRIGILLAYCPSHTPQVSLPELTEAILDLTLRMLRFAVLGSFNIHTEAALTGASQDFMAAMTTMGYPRTFWYLQQQVLHLIWFSLEIRYMVW